MNQPYLESISKVLYFMTQVPVPAPLPPKGGSVYSVMKMTICLAVAIGNCMQRTITSDFINRTKFYIKLFLLAYDIVDKALLKEGEKPGWLTS